MELFALHPSAEDDLGEILDYIGQDSFDSAVRALMEFEDAFAQLGRSPGMGRYRPDLEAGSLRFWSVWRYLIAYDPETDPIKIVAVIHGMRDPGKIAEILSKR